MTFSMNEPVRILVVDDSAFMRSAIKGMINSDPELKVVGTAKDGEDALAKIEELKPDIVTLDLLMPKMDGLTVLKIIMEKMPLPVLVFSSLTEDGGAKATFDALELGAVDFICKDLRSGLANIMNLRDTLIYKLKEVACKRIKLKTEPQERVLQAAAAAVPQPIREIPSRAARDVDVVAIGISTGGPKALQEMVPLIPKDFPVPILIVQHMPVMFTKPFAERLNSLSQVAVKEAETGDLIEPGKVYIARGGIHMRVKRVKPGEVRVELSPNPEHVLYRPSVDIMMASVVEAYGARILGVIMTGMGNDGTEGMRSIKNAGGKTLAQDEASCVVFGMPKSVVAAGVVDKVVPLASLANEIVRLL